ncbi:MAG: hypothetical protein ACLTIF_13290 [Lachnospiraceae bacterium]
MELNELNLFFLLVSKSVIVKVPIADDVRSDFFGKIRFSGTGRTSENQIFDSISMEENGFRYPLNC